nr:hypothetical protein [Tanacetum cinerariifolium]
VEGLENANAAQQLEIVKLKAMVKKLEKLNQVKSSKLRRLNKVGTSQRVKSSDDVENVFNHGRNIVDMDQDEGIELTNIANLSKHTTRYISPVLTQKVFANIRRVGKGFLGVETPLFENMLAVRDVDEEEEAQVLAQGDDVQEHAAEEVTTEVVPPTPTSPSPSSHVISSSPLHQSPCPPQPQDAEGSSHLFQQ